MFKNYFAVSLKKEFKSLKEKLRDFENDIKEHNKIIEAPPEYFTAKQVKSFIKKLKNLIRMKQLMFCNNYYMKKKELSLFVHLMKSNGSLCL